MIGVFDSGLGGLTVLKYFIKQLPDYNYIYLGDNARAPYGSKSQDIIYEYTKQAVDFLFSQGCKLIIIACNTVSSQALRKIQREYLHQNYPKDYRVLGVVRPLVEKVAKERAIKKIGVLGTRATIDSHVYQIELNKINPNVKIYEESAPLLVPLIEEGWVGEQETRSILKKYLQPFKEKEIDVLVLACTHYPFLLEGIRKIMGKKCKVYNPGEIIVESLADYLKRHSELGIKKSKKPKYKFYTTENVDRFKELGTTFLNYPIIDIKKLILK